MRRMLIVAGLFVGLFSAARAGTAPFPVTPEAGAWMILVQSYTGDASAVLAEELATSLRRDYRINSFILNRGDEERVKERARIEDLRRQHAAALRAAGAAPDVEMPRIKTYRIDDQYAVLIGGWKDQDSARKALDQVRNLKPPSDKLSHKAVVVESVGGDKGEIKYASVNPFKTAFVVRNPLVPAQADPEKGKLQNLKEYNADETFSLLKCKKPFTLMVKTYQGAVSLTTADTPTKGFLEKFGGAKGGKLLNAGANQAHELAIALAAMEKSKGQKVIQTDVYVLHTEHSSYVCVGGFAKPDDPTLLQYQKTLAGLKLGPFETLLAQPMPMPVPKP